MDPVTPFQESKEIKRLRRRLSKRLEQLDKRLTPEALAHMTQIIKDLSQRKGLSQLDLKKKHVSLYPKKTKESKATLKLKELIKRDYFPQ